MSFNVFAIVFEGSSYLGFDKWSFSQVMIVTLGAGFLAAVIVQLFVVKRLRQSIVGGEMESLAVSDSPRGNEKKESFDKNFSQSTNPLLENGKTQDNNSKHPLQLLLYRHFRCSYHQSHLFRAQLLPFGQTRMPSGRAALQLPSDCNRLFWRLCPWR